MQNNLVFKTGLAKRTLGWLVFLAAAGTLVATIYAIFTHPAAQAPSEFWSGVVIAVFLIGIMVAGIAVQYVRWSVEGGNIIYRRLFRSRTIPISELAGFGQIIVVVTVLPFVHVDLFDRELKLIARLPVSHKDWPKAEAWLAGRLRYVVNDGSHILPKYRFIETSRIQPPKV